MKKIEVLGTGCKKCVTTEEMIAEKASELDIQIQLEHVYDPIAIASKGIMTTPAVMVDGKLVHKGGLPKDEEIEQWLT